jgi:hypothetical protein
MTAEWTGHGSGGWCSWSFWLSIVGNQAYYCCVVCKLDDWLGGVRGYAFMGEREYRRGLSTHPCGFLEEWLKCKCKWSAKWRCCFLPSPPGGHSSGSPGPSCKSNLVLKAELQCLRKVFRPLELFHNLLHYNLILKLIKLKMASAIYTQYNITTKWKQVF